MATGKLIVFEGPEGAGKTTQLKRLAERLSVVGLPCLAMREPGGTPVGDAIREILLDPERELTDATEALLFMASRAELIAREIRPALKQGTLVLLDRFFLSTYAYQVAGRGLPEEEIRAANRLATDGLVPDLTLLLDISAREGLARADARGDRDRMEKSGAEFHDRVAGAFRQFTEKAWQDSHPECGPVTLIDGVGSEIGVFERITSALSRAFPKLFGSLAS
jgi:dTMP kinase